MRTEFASTLAIREAYSSTQYAATAAQMMRFGRMGEAMKSDDMPEGMTADEWQKSHGPHGTNLTHGAQTAQEFVELMCAERFVNPDSFTDEQIELGAAAGEIHDHAEPDERVGDLPYPTTEADKELQKQVHIAHISDYTPGLSDEHRATYVKGLEVVYGDGKTNYMSGKFEIAEKIGYLNVALGSLRSIRKLQAYGAGASTEVLRSMGLRSPAHIERAVTMHRWIASEVLSNDVVELLIAKSCPDETPTLLPWLLRRSAAISSCYAFDREDQDEFALRYDKLDPRARPGKAEQYYDNFCRQGDLFELWRAEHP